jgi:ATP phosphoribosyltransferase regulatory subunit
MASFPTYGPQEIDALNGVADAVLGVFQHHGYTRHEPAVLQPAHLFVDRSGEEIRRRTYELTDPTGEELCLRPDLTIPTCKFQVDSGKAYPARLCYHGLAFRHQPGAGQFWQAGAELLGLPDRAAGDAEMMGLAAQAVRAGGVKDFSVLVGDLGLFNTLVDALEVPAQWRGRLKRHVWRTGYFEKLLARMVAGEANEAERTVDALAGLKLMELKPAIEALIDKEGDAPLGGRTRDDIIERLMVQACDDTAPRLDPDVAALISAFLKVNGNGEAALEEIRSLTKPVAAKMVKPLAAMAERLHALKSMDIPLDKVRYVAHFGRNLEYYTGFVFEFWTRAGEVAGGGRYDTLLESLGAPRGTTAIGCAIRTERLLAARGEA